MGKVLSEMSFQLLIFPPGKVSSQKLAELTDGLTACPSNIVAILAQAYSSKFENFKAKN